MQKRVSFQLGDILYFYKKKLFLLQKLPYLFTIYFCFYILKMCVVILP